MFKGLLAAALVVAATTGMAGTDHCGKRDQVVAQLELKFAEQLTAGGLQATEPVETMLEVWASPETGTFTILLTDPNGTSCIIAAGTDFFSGPAVSAPAAQKS